MLQAADHEQEFPHAESRKVSTVATKKEKEPKRKKLRKGTLVETAAAEEIE